MSTESNVSDPYAIVLADLSAQRDKIDAAIAAILALRPSGAPAPLAPPAIQTIPVVKPSAPERGQLVGFAGMTIPEAAKVIIEEAGSPVNNATILERLQARGMEFTAVDPLNTVGAVLSRRFHDVGDIVRVARGTWGLKEWYPEDQTFGRKAGDVTSDPATSAPEQPSTPKQLSVLD
jgi:HB1, ASXL, restriction endonuclease HTH domain